MDQATDGGRSGTTHIAGGKAPKQEGDGTHPATHVDSQQRTPGRVADADGLLDASAEGLLDDRAHL